MDVGPARQPRSPLVFQVGTEPHFPCLEQFPTDKDTTKKENYIPDEHKCQNPQKNISKLNTAMHQKDHTPRPSQIYSRNARLVQHYQISNWDSPHEQKEG